jgi:hypothetical protein
VEFSPEDRERERKKGVLSLTTQAENASERGRSKREGEVSRDCVRMCVRVCVCVNVCGVTAEKNDNQSGAKTSFPRFFSLPSSLHLSIYLHLY